MSGAEAEEAIACGSKAKVKCQASVKQMCPRCCRKREMRYKKICVARRHGGTESIRSR